MSLRTEMMEVLNSKFKDVEFTSEDLQKYFPNHKRKPVQKIISMLISDNILSRCGFKQVLPNRRYNVYWLGKKPFKPEEEIMTKATIPEWAEVWPHVWKGLKEKRI